MATPRNVGRTKNTLDRKVFNVQKIQKCHWIGKREWKIIVINDIQPNLTKNATLHGKREKCSVFSFDNALRFPLPNCQFLTNLNFVSSFVTLI